MAVPFLSLVLQNLNTLIQNEVGLLWGVDKEMEKLSSTLSTIQAVLEDAERKQLRDKAIQNWLRKLNDAAYEADDILDDCATEALRCQSEGQGYGSLKKVGTSLLTCYPAQNIPFRHKIGNRIKEITEKLDVIAEERIKFHLHEGAVETRVEYAENRETSSLITQPQLYGRDKDKEKIVKVLVEDICDCQDVSVYPIIGIGGLGKTTLAQMVFNDDGVKGFEPKIWAYVSEVFDVKMVIKAIIKSASGEESQDLDLGSLQRTLQDMLNGKRYLIVLDDVWNDDQEKWYAVKNVLNCGSKGASIIVTTRVQKVASIMGTIPPHQLQLLSEDDCWLLFKQRAFGHGNEEHPNLVAIGKEIVKKCGGVPLAAKALGGLMRFKSEENEWLFVLKSEIWNLDENSILPALRLSYYNLPLELRRCFAYCAVFSKGFGIEKENLIHLWMANGFISSKGKLELEDIGNGIWNELLWRSFFEDVRNLSDNIITFKMHDLMHDLAQSVMEDECHMMVAEESSSNISKQRIRHVTLVAEDYDSGVFPTLPSVGSLRSILLQPRVNSDALSCSRDFKNSCSLRVFNAWGTKMEHLSSSIGNLKHLRYLNLSQTSIRTLPKSICSLHNLQTLNLNYCFLLQSLPKNMKYLRSLRHLYFEGCLSIYDTPPKLGQLTLLKTLSLFVVGKSKGRWLAELKHLDLGGKLRIQHLEKVRNSMDAKEANLVGKKNLRILQLSWERYNYFESQENVEEILEALEPHPNVEVLFINNYRGAHFPLWMRDLILKNIFSIRLDDCRNCSVLPAFGQLPSLRRLHITGMDYVEFVDNDSPIGGPVRGFPFLEELHISELPNLKRLSREEGRELFPRLRYIFIERCPKLSLPCLSSLESLIVLSCSNVTLCSISNLNHLTSLIVHGDDDVISFPEEKLQNLTSLQTLEIRSFRKLKVLPTNLESLVSLKSLDIWWCHELESLPDHGLQSLKSLQHLKIIHCNNLSSLSVNLGHLTALEKLDVSGCPELLTLPESIKHLNSLRHLCISGVSKYSSNDLVIGAKLKTLPEALQHVPALQSLSISDYPELTSLPEWLGNLTSLQSLDIRFCPKISSLPHSFRSLTKLQTLRISGHKSGYFPELARRCQKGEGEDWHKIAHVPVVDIDWW